MKEKNMNVYELQERILELSHDEVTHDTGLRGRSLRWLNSAYHELMEILMPLLSDSLSADTIVEVVENAVILPQKAQKILLVEDAEKGGSIPYKAPHEVLVKNTELSYQQTVDGLKLIGKNIPQKLRVVFVPQISDLLEDDTENSILIPPQFHTSLIWGALVWAAVFERGFTSQRELSLYQAKWEEAKRNVKLSLVGRHSSILKVDEFHIV